VLRRPAVLTAIALGAIFFLGTSIMLARGFSATNAERGKVLDVLRAQARGDSARVLALLPECAAVPACATTVRSRAGELRRDGDVEILQYRPSVQLAITDEEGPARVAWRAGTSRPVVQCVQVRRTGALNGARAELIAIGNPVDGEASCR
jgi:hypothetical protein